MLPDHAPDAAQPLVFVDDHDRVDTPPVAMDVGFAVNESVGVVGGGTVVRLTVTLFVIVPKLPVHASLNVLAVVNAPVD